MNTPDKEQKTPEFNEIVGNNLRLIRKLKGINQEQLADAIGLTRTSLVNIEKGRTGLSAINIYNICNYLEVSPSDLFPHSENSINILIQSTIHKLEFDRDSWKGKYEKLTGILSELKTHIP